MKNDLDYEKTERLRPDKPPTQNTVCKSAREANHETLAES